MKHLNALHARVNSPFAVAQESIDAVAMEGIVDAVKEKWNALKEKLSPSDAAKTAKQMEALAKVRKDLVQAKGAFSQADGSKTVNVKMTKIGHFPVGGKSADELIANLSAWRKKTAVAIKKVQGIKDEAQASAAAKELQANMATKGEIATEMVWDKARTIKFLDEAILTIDMMSEVHKLTLAGQRQAKSQGVATESFDDVAVALEGIGEGIWGALKIYIGYFVFVWSVIAGIGAVVLLVTGAIVPALITGGVAYALAKGGNALFTGGVRNIKNAVDSTKKPAAPAADAEVPAAA